jgi:hypothetical protein
VMHAQTDYAIVIVESQSSYCYTAKKSSTSSTSKSNSWKKLAAGNPTTL